MNQRIQQLALQAGFTVVRAPGLKDTVPKDVFIANVCVSNEMQKFAELIVRECADKVVQPYMSQWPEDHVLTRKIKQHFGVDV